MRMNPLDRSPIGRTPLRVTRFGLGGAALGNLFQKVDEATARRTLDLAFDRGLRYVDTAPYYGHGLSEHRIGEALRGRERSEFVISTKVGRLLRPLRGRAMPDTGYVDTLPFEPVFDYGYAAVMRSFEDSLQRIGTDSLDILLVHDIGRMTHGDRHPELFRALMSGGYRALDELRSAGVVKAIGLGVNEIEVCLEAMDHGRFDCFLLAGRYTLLEQRALDELFPRCVREGVSIILGGPYNSGLLTGEPKVGANYNYAPAAREIVERAHRLYEVCRGHGVPLEAAALQFPLHHPAVATVIPGARNDRELGGNLEFFSTPIPPALWRDLKSAGLLRPDAPTE